MMRERRKRDRRKHRRSSGGPPIDPAAWRLLAACTAAAAVLQIDGTLITVALPDAGRALSLDTHLQGLVLGVYFLAYALALWPGGRLVDAVGTRTVALSGLGIFAVGAAVGAVAGSGELLLGSRVIQGIGAGIVSPAALAGAISGFPPAKRGMALGIWGAGSGMANLAGPLIGGALTVLLGWRADWWALVPLAAVSALAMSRMTPRRIASERNPRTPLPHSSVIASAVLVATLTFAVMIGTFFVAEQYLQDVAGYSALGAAAALILVALLVAVAAPLAGRLADARGERLPAITGFTLAGIALAILGIPGVPLHGLAPLPLLLPVGLGLGLLFAPTSRAALNAAPDAGHGRVSALLSAGRLIGAGIGAAVAGVALGGGVSTAGVHNVLLGAAALCLLLGAPAAARLSRRRSPISPEPSPEATVEPALR